MRARTYRAVAPVDPAVTSNTISNIGRALLIVAILLIVVVSVRWLGERRIENRVAAQPTPVVESVSVQPTPIPYSAQVDVRNLSQFSTRQIEHQRCENLGYTDVIFEERPYGWYVTCKE